NGIRTTTRCGSVQECPTPASSTRWERMLPFWLKRLARWLPHKCVIEERSAGISVRPPPPGNATSRCWRLVQRSSWLRYTALGGLPPPSSTSAHEEQCADRMSWSPLCCFPELRDHNSSARSVHGTRW